MSASQDGKLIVWDSHTTNKVSVVVVIGAHFSLSLLCTTLRCLINGIWSDDVFRNYADDFN